MRPLHFLHGGGDVAAELRWGRYGGSSGAGGRHHVSDEQAHCCKEGGSHGV